MKQNCFIYILKVEICFICFIKILHNPNISDTVYNMPSVRKIAKKAGVSPATVSRVLTQSASVKPDKVKKVLNAIKALEQHEPNIEGGSVGLIIPSSLSVDPMEHHGLFLAMNGFIEVMSQHGISNTTLILDQSKTSLAQLFSNLHDGYSVMGTNEEQEESIISYLSDKNIPCVLLNRVSNATRVGCVLLDDEVSTEKAVQHLISYGHSKIAFVGGPANFQNTKRRLEGYKRALLNSGISIDENYIIYGEYNEAFGKSAGELLLSMKNRPTAAFCTSDSIAVGCMKTLKKAGLTLPEDFAIASHGNEEIYRYITPSLTTVGQPSRIVGETVAQVLLHMIKTPLISTEKIILKTNLIIGESSNSKIQN